MKTTCILKKFYLGKQIIINKLIGLFDFWIQVWGFKWIKQTCNC